MKNLYNIALPPFKFADPGLDWQYAGWIAKGTTYEDSVRKEKLSDHGEERRVDEYPEGAVCFFK